MPNNYKEALDKIATLVGYKFNNEETTKVDFERVALEGGEVFITNQAEGELTLGDTIYIETEEGFEPAVSGTHRLDDGREIVLDEESILVEIREEASEEEVEEVVEETSNDDEEMSEETTPNPTTEEITKLKEAIHDLLMTFNQEVETINDKFNSFVEDYNEFKKSESITPLKEESKVKQDFSKMRLEIINKMKNKK